MKDQHSTRRSRSGTSHCSQVDTGSHEDWFRGTAAGLPSQTTSPTRTKRLRSGNGTSCWSVEVPIQGHPRMTRSLHLHLRPVQPPLQVAAAPAVHPPPVRLGHRLLEVPQVETPVAGEAVLLLGSCHCCCFIDDGCGFAPEALIRAGLQMSRYAAQCGFVTKTGWMLCLSKSARQEHRRLMRSICEGSGVHTGSAATAYTQSRCTFHPISDVISITFAGRERVPSSLSAAQTGAAPLPA